MESAEERQQQEITALQSIYADDFIECPPPKAWKAATRLPEFTIRIPHPNTDHADAIYVHLNVKFPKTYPSIACPTFTILQPIKGIPADRVAKLTGAIHAEAQKLRGSEMVFQIVTFAQDWMSDNVQPAGPGSLATEMNKRALDEELARKARADALAQQERERAAQRAAELQTQIRVDAERQQADRELALAQQQQQRARRRLDTEVSENSLADTPTETFAEEIVVQGLRFNTVKLFHARKECLGMTYLAEPVCDDVQTTLPLEMYSVVFSAHYYTTTQGRKKLKQLETEINRLASLRHENLLSVYAVKLSLSTTDGSSRLVILCEQRPSSSLQEVLADCEALREDRAIDYLRQTLSALQVIHQADLVHRGLCLDCIGLAPRPDTPRGKIVKVGKTGFHVRILALHKSNPIRVGLIAPEEPAELPEAWQPKEAIDSPLLYTRSRDLHCAGLMLLQMLLGTDVMDRYLDPQSALHFSSVTPSVQQFALNMLAQSKKNGTVSCATLLVELSDDFAARNSKALVSRSPGIPIPNASTTSLTGPKTPMPPYSSPPDRDYFQLSSIFRGRATHSRWKEDWEELELLGRGAFGSVVKARNKIDHRIYAVKKIRLRATQTRKDDKIFREVNTLSRLNHRFIVRYFTTWIEASEPVSAVPSDSDTEDDSSDKTASASVSGSSSLRTTRHDGDSEDSFGDPLHVNLDELGGGSYSKGSFPSIHFGNADKDGSSDDESLSEEEDNMPIFKIDGVGSDTSPKLDIPSPRPLMRTLYIQMEFVERQTLKERIAEGLTESDAWNLFHQIVDALVHIASLGILHRDIKLTNIFIDAKGDVKVGDFGLATSSLAAVDPSDLTLQATSSDADMTLEVGTRLYIAPEVQSPKGGLRGTAKADMTKADMYSLGIVFFEMNFMFSTGAERIVVIERLRQSEIIFPSTWDPLRTRQRSIIEWLLQHDPGKRPSALELSQSSLLPPRIEDEYFKGALRMMTKSDSPHYQAVLASLFSQPPRPTRSYLYDHDHDLPEHASLQGVVQDKLRTIFHLRGAVDMEPSLLMPASNLDNDNNPLLIDRHGDVVALPDDAIVPFARLAAKREVSRIKRYHIGNTWKANIVPGHPHVLKSAVFDIITPDLTHGPAAAAAETIAVTEECMNAFPTLGPNCEIRITHTGIKDIVLSRIPAELREDVVDILKQSKSTSSQKRAMLLKKGLLRSAADELEILCDEEEDMDLFISKLEKLSPSLATAISPYLEEIRETTHFAVALGVTRPIIFLPLMLYQDSYFKDGIYFEVVRRKRRTDVMASGGRYDSLINSMAPPKQSNTTPVCAMGAQIALDKITAVLAAYQGTSVKNLIKEQRSFGYWSPRRCDVYVVSYQAGYLHDRLEVAAMLWHHGISADVMYESGLHDTDQENHLDVCIREGILFTIYPRPRAIRRDQAAFKVKSVLKGTEYEVSRQDLVSWLQQQIADQKRVDQSTSGVDSAIDILPNSASTKDALSNSDIHLVLPGDTKKQRKQTKQMFLDRAFDIGAQVKAAVQGGMQVLAVDVPTPVFDALTRSAAWVTDDDIWRGIAAGFPTGQSAYAQQVREDAQKRKSDGHRFLLLFAVREERVGLLTL